jgi:thiol:disulfide interchange protein DsbC
MKSLITSALVLCVTLLTSISTVYANEDDIKQLKARLPSVLPAAANATIKTTPIAGLYEVLSAGQIMYMTKDARFVLDGDLYDMQSRVNITENTRGSIRLDALNELGEENMLVFKPEGEVKHTITVFTDIFCPYCVRLHSEIDEYMKGGVKVRYIFAPFKGQRSVDTSIAVWCAKDRNNAFNMANSGEELEKKTCDNPVSKHQVLVTALAIRGTPAIMLESGQLMPGYVPAAKLIEQLNRTL